MVKEVLAKLKQFLSADQERRHRPAVAREGRRFELGRKGEQLAAEFLAARSYAIVAANVELPVGRNSRGALVKAEIDLVAYDGETLCFVEVKTRTSEEFAAPETNVNLRKRRQITRAARVYRRMLGVFAEPHRFDVVSIVMGEGTERPKVRLLKGFWNETQFRKRKWHSFPDDF